MTRIAPLVARCSVVAAICLSLFVGDSTAVNVRSYYRKDGTYVRAHTRSSPRSYSTGSSSSYSSSWVGSPYVLPKARTSAPKGRTARARSGARTSAVDLTAFDGSDVVNDESEPPTALPTFAAAQSAIARAEAYEASNNYIAAVRELHRIRRSWPSTAASKRAGERLAKIRSDEPFRTWKSADGKFSIVAKFVREEGSRVVLETKEGTTRRIDFTKLSNDDRTYVAMRRRPV